LHVRLGGEDGGFETGRELDHRQCSFRRRRRGICVGLAVVRRREFSSVHANESKRPRYETATQCGFHGVHVAINHCRNNDNLQSRDASGRAEQRKKA
jgi:hypothetical protein